MSDDIKHECGIALLRLKKPLSYYKEKYGSYLYGLTKLYLLMEKQHNRGQDGAGVAAIKIDPLPGYPYIHRQREYGSSAIGTIFGEIQKEIKEAGFLEGDSLESQSFPEGTPYVAELLLGHLRYGTFARQGVEFCHPFIRQNNWMTKTLVMAGNFNLTNNEELFGQLIALGQHPRNRADTVTVMEKIGHYLDKEAEVSMSRQDSNREIDLGKVLRSAVPAFDGGYTIAGLIGNGDAFVVRDPNGIRPAFYFEDDEVVVATSERPPIKTALDIQYHQIKEIPRGHALIIKKNGSTSLESIVPQREMTQCSFERIYFSRGTDRAIYQERKELGRLIAPMVLQTVGKQNLDEVIFSYIPNTAEVAFLGMMEAVDDHYNAEKILAIQSASSTSPVELERILQRKPRTEKIAVKDAKLRTFITNSASRSDLVSHVYDTTYGLVEKGADTIVVIDDSIVRGTTLANSILRILDRLQPKKIVIVSSAPQIRYPDCYGIDMSRLSEFVCFKAAIALHKDAGREELLNEIFTACQADASNPDAPNHVKKIYDGFSDEDISRKSAEILRGQHTKAEVELIFQTVDNLHIACPDHKGDWYFTGNYPTTGGNRVVNRSYINFYQGIDARAY